MINTQKAILVYNKNTNSPNVNFNLNQLNGVNQPSGIAGVADKIELITRVSPDGSAFQYWSPNASDGPVRQFGSLTCGGVYIIETLPGVSFPYQLTNDGSDDGLRPISDYDKNICLGGTPAPTSTLAPTPTPTLTPTLAPTPTPTKTQTPAPTLPKQITAVAVEPLCGPTPLPGYPDLIPCQGSPDQTLYYNSGAASPPESTLDFVSVCQNGTLSLDWKQAQTVDDQTKGPPIQLRISGAFVGIIYLEKQYYASQEFVNPSLSDGATIRYKCACNLYQGKVTSTFLNNPEVDSTNQGGTIHLDLINDQCPPTPTPPITPTPTKTPTPTPTSNKINITASSFNAALGSPCNSGVTCPDGSFFPDACCGTTGQLEYEGSVLDGLISYQSVGYNSTISFDPLPTVTPSATPVIVYLKLPNGSYFGQLTMNTTNFLGKNFQVNYNGTRYSGIFGPEVTMTQV